MSPQSKKEYLAAIVKRYKKANKTQKHIILDEFCAATIIIESMPSACSGALNDSPSPNPNPEAVSLAMTLLNS